MADTFRNIRDDGIIKVENAVNRLALLPTNGTVVLQLDTDELYAWNEDSQIWILLAGGGGPSFGIIQTDTGTSPTATGPSDTLTITTNYPTFADFNGDAISDTVSLTFQYVPEDVDNKSTDGTLAANSTTLYPSQSAVKTYADSKVADEINDGETSIAPSQNAVFDALALKLNIADAVTDHTELTSIGTNTHAQIDSHIANTSNPHNVTAAQIGAVTLTGDQSISGVKTFATAYPVGPGTTPTLDDELVDKTYVDTLLTTGARFVDAVYAATTSALPANTYDNGTAGVGATLTGNSNGAFPTIDGQIAVQGNKYLIKDELTQANNGAYELTQLGDGSNPYILTRIGMYDQATEIVSGTFFNVLGGTDNGNTQWLMNAATPSTIGTDPIYFGQLSAFPTITASLGVEKVGNDLRANLNAAGAITLSGNEIGVATDNSSVEISSNAIRVKALGITNAMLAGSIANGKLSTINTAGKVTGDALTSLANTPSGAGVLPVANGSTGFGSYTNGDLLYANTSSSLAKLGVGTAGQVLGVVAGFPAWTTPPSSGVLTTIQYSKSLDTDSSAVSVSNTITETTIYSYTVSANELGTNKIVNGIIQGTYLNNSGANRTVRVRVKYGATTILDKTSGNLAANASTGNFQIQFYLANQNATNVQEAYMICSFESGANVSVNFDDRGVAAIDSTSSQSLVVTVTLSAATATQTLLKRLATLNMLNASDDVGGTALQTNSIANGTQGLLNLIEGANITLTDNGSGGVTIDGSGATIGDPVSGGTNNEVLYVNGSGNLDSDSNFMRLQDDQQSSKLLSKIKASYFYDDGVSAVSMLADFAGANGNSISIVADGINDFGTLEANWNAGNPSNTVTFTYNSGTVSTDIPNAGTYTLTGGNDGTGFFSGVYSNVPELNGIGLGIEAPISATETAINGVYNYPSLLGTSGVGAIIGTIDITNKINNVSIVGSGLVYSVASDGIDLAFHLIHLDEGNSLHFNNGFLGVDIDETVLWGNGSINYKLPKTSTPVIGDIIAVTNVAGTIHNLDFIRNRTGKESVSSANDLDLPYPAKVFEVSGTTQINGIKLDDFEDGEEAILIFTNALIVKHNGIPSSGYEPILLSGSVDFNATADSVLHLIFDGTYFREISRVVP